MRHRLLLSLGLLALCASLAACGGSSTATATIASPTRAATNAPAAASAAAPVAATTAPTSAAVSSSATAATRPAGSAAATAAPTTPTDTPKAAPTTAPTAPAASVAATTVAPAAAGGNAVAVQLMDFAITVDKSTVSAGMVTFTIKNNGPSPHNFNVKINGEEKGVPTLDPGTTTTLTLDLKPGTYDYRCNIPGHDLLGMKGTLTVK